LFDLLDKPLHWISVKWPALLAPEDDSNLSQPGEHEVELRVELVDREEAIWRLPALFGEDDKPRGKPPEICASKDNPEEWGPSPTSFDTFKRVVHSWRKISAKGRKVEMTDDNIRLLLSAPMFEAAFAIAYVSALGGRTQVREGNSGGSASGGREEPEKSATERASDESVTSSE
jgi:hypothetical protein